MERSVAPCRAPAQQCGITPFLRWISAFPRKLTFDIDSYYTVRTPQDALFEGELEAASARHIRGHSLKRTVTCAAPGR
jgi:predicted ferric reductase